MGRGPTAADTSDLKPSALFLFPLRSALFLRRLCRFLLRFLLPVHTLAHGSPPHDGEQSCAPRYASLGTAMDRSPPLEEGAEPRTAQAVNATLCVAIPGGGGRWQARFTARIGPAGLSCLIEPLRHGLGHASLAVGDQRGVASAPCARQSCQLAVCARRLIIGQSGLLLSHESSESLWEQRGAEVKSLVLIAAQLGQQGELL